MRIPLDVWNACQGHLIRFWKAEAEKGAGGVATLTRRTALADGALSFFFGRRRRFSRATMVELQPGPMPMSHYLTAQERFVVEPAAEYLTALFGKDWMIDSVAWAEGLTVQPWEPETLTFRDDSVDIVLALNVLDKVRHPEAVAAEAVRAVKPGGLVCVENYLQKGRPVTTTHRATHPHDFDRGGLVQMFDGLELVKEDLQEWNDPAAYPRWRGLFRKVK